MFRVWGSGCSGFRMFRVQDVAGLGFRVQPPRPSPETVAPNEPATEVEAASAFWGVGFGFRVGVV